MNELVEPLAFSSLSIQFSIHTWKSVPDFLLSLTYGASPYVRWARALHVMTIYPEFYRPLQETERKTLHQEKGLLTPALNSLLQVESATWVACHPLLYIL